ncbi:MAG: lipocalin-like domain-containing protein [Bacteroidota bacterium]
MSKLSFLLLFICMCNNIVSQEWKVYPYTPDGSFIVFPSDEGRHTAEPVEWWYTTGHITGENSGRTYSYMLSYFYKPVNNLDGFRILNISDDETGEFLTDTKALTYSILSTDSLNIEAELLFGGTEYWCNQTDADGSALPFSYVLSAEGDNAAIQLEYDAFKPPLILADSGLLKQGPAAYTYYYSQTGNDVTGTINFDGLIENVSGTAWIDRQYGSVNPAEGLEYEWFSLQLSNGIDINVNNIFTEENDVPETLEYRLLCAYVDEQTQFTTSSFDIERLEYHYTPDSLKCYSIKWRLTSDQHNIDLTISALYPGYEVSLPFRFYEGPTHITGTVEGIPVSGKGFAELLHSYEKPDIVIESATNLWEESTELKWMLTNPDHGNPVRYDIEYSIDNKETFNMIAGNLDDTVYYWDSSKLSGGEEIWLKVKGFSVDTTLVDSSMVRLTSFTGIEKEEWLEGIKVFPNPNDGYFTVRGEFIREIEIVDIKGRKVFSSHVNGRVYDVDISKEPPGLYFVRLTLNRGLIIRKVIVE